MQLTTVMPTKNRIWPWREVSPYGNRLSAHARNAKSQYAAQHHRRPQGTGRGLRFDHAVAAPQPDQATDRASPDQNAGKHDGQARRRDGQMGKRQRDRIHAQDEIEQRHLPRKRRELRPHQFMIFGIDPK